VAALNYNSSACANALGVTVAQGTGGNTSEVVVTENTPGAFPTLSGGTTNSSSAIFSWGTASGGTQGSNTCSGTAGTFATGASATDTTTMASNLAAAINDCSPTYASTVLASASYSSSTVTITATINGNFVLVPTASQNSGGTVFTITGPSTSTTLNGANTCTGSGPWTANFATSGTLSTIAGDVTIAINACTSGSKGVTATGNAIVSTTAPGSGASLAVTTNNTGIFNWSGTGITGGGGSTTGTDGTNSSTQFTYWQGSNYLSPAQVATNIANAVNSNTTLQGSTGVGAAANTPASGNVTFTANVIGTGTFTVTQGSFSAFTAGSLTAGTNGPTGTVQPNASPAKFSFSTTSATCSDFIVYPIGTAVAAGSANIVAYNNIYTTGCAGQVPSVLWTYHTGGWVTTSPILSFDATGSQVAFIQVSGTTPVASLVILKWAASTSGTLTSQTAANYRNCTAPCMLVLTFSGSPSDTFSSPFYDYTNDALYVGDDSGNLHKFTGVFNGTPAESLTLGLPWVNLGSSKLSSPVYDSSSGYVIVGDFGGILHSVTATTGAVHGTQTGIGDVLADAPLVDGSNGILFAFVTSSSYSYTNYNAVYELSTGFTGCTFGTSGCYPGVEPVSAGAGNTGYYLYAGTFDNVYYESSSPPSGNIYVVGNTGAAATTGGVLYRIPITGGGMSGVTAVATVTADAHPWPSPATEFCNNGTSACAVQTASASGCTVSTTSRTLSCTTGNFTSADVGLPITGTDIAAGATVTAFGSSTSITMSADGTAGTTTGTANIGVTTSGTDYLFFSVNRGTGCSSSGAGTGCILSYNITNWSSVTQAGGATSGLGVTTPGTNGCWATGALVIDNSVPSGTMAGASQVYSVELNGSAAGYPGTLTNGGCSGTTTSAIIEGVQALQSSP
jgi:hypothetical protein